MQSNFWAGSKNLDGHKTFWELGHVKGQGIIGSLDSFLLFLKTKFTTFYHGQNIIRLFRAKEN